MMKKAMKVFTSVIAICVTVTLLTCISTVSVSAYTYGSNHTTGNIVSKLTGTVKADTVDTYEEFTLTEADKIRANSGQLQIYGSAEYWRQACATIKANITFTYYNASGGKISSNSASVNDYYSIGGWKNTLTINYTKVPAGTSKIRIGIYSYNSLTYDMEVRNIKVYLKDESAPLYTVCAPVTSPAKYKLGTTIRYQVKFSEPVNVSNAGYLNFKVGSQEVNSQSKYVSQSSDKTTLYYDFTLPETSTTGDNLAVSLTSISNLTVNDDAQNSITVNKTLNQNNGFYVDNKPPVIASMTTDASSGSVYKTGEKLVFDAAFSENVWVSGSPYISLSNGKKATYVKKTSTDTNICSFEYVINDGDDVENIAITGADLSGIYDVVSNNATEAPTYSTSAFNNFMNGRNVSVDTKVPEVEFPELTLEWAKEHSVEVVPKDNISGVKAIYAVWVQGEGMPVYPEAPNVDSNTNQVVTPSESGEYKLYVKVEDNVGNMAAYPSPYTYKVDLELPVIERDYTTAEGMVDTITATASDSRSGVKSFTYRWINEIGAEVLTGLVEDGIKKPVDDGIYTITLTATDNAGNIATDSIEDLRVDSVAPQVAFKPDGGSDYKKSHTTIADVTDEKSGVKKYYYLWSESTQKPDMENENWTLATDDTCRTPDNKTGTWYLHIKAEDNVGNKTIATSSGFNIDNFGPEISLTPDGNEECMGETSLDVRITLADSISLSSEITAWYAISEDKEDYGEFLPLTSELVTVDTVNTPKYLTIKAIDKVGNESLVQSKAYMPDLIAPDGEINKAEDKYYININTVNVRISASDDCQDTVFMQIKVDDTEGDWEDLDTAKTLAFAETQGKHTVSVRFKDKSGNVSDYKTVSYYYDATAPEISLVYSDEALTNEAVTVTASAVDESSEVTFVTEEEKVFDVNGSFEFVVSDEAGNIARKTAVVENIDKTNPEIIVTSDYFNGRKYKEATVTINADDENGIGKLEYAVVENGAEPGEMTECRKGDKILIKDLDGTYYVAVRATDVVGNTNEIKSQNILFDNIAPIANISYEPSKRTARDVVATISFNEDTTVTNNGGSTSYTFTDNGEFTFNFTDEAGNIGTQTASVSWIDRTQPTARVIFSHEGWTNEAITVTLLPQPQSIVRDVFFNGEPVEENELNTYTFDQYGILEYQIYDIETEMTTDESVIIKVDKTAPTIKEIHYSETEWTNNDVTVTIDAEDDLSEITYINGKIYTFTENGEFIFKVEDRAGNVTEQLVVADNIDKNTPVPTVIYYTDGNVYNTETPTNKNVVASVTFDNGGAPVSMVNNDGSFDYEFASNGNFKFMFTDQAGNSGEVTASVSEIDKIAPAGYVTYSKSSWTNEDVIATLHISDDRNSVVITNNEASENYTFTQNGEFVFEFKDAAGNIASSVAEVGIIDKQSPELSYVLSTTEPTPFSVFATVAANEKVTFINNDGKPSRQFTSNGEYRFEVVDKAGNTAEINVVVANISKETTPVKLVYSETQSTNQDVFVTIEPQDGKSYIYVTNNNGQKTKRFTENGEFTFTYKNAAGIEGEATASVTNIDKTAPVVTVSYSHNSATNENVVATFKCEENVEYPYLIIDGKYTFEENRKILFPVKDASGNVANVIAQTSLIDKKAPKIEMESSFDIVAIGDSFDAMEGISASDDNELDGQITAEGEVNTSEEGTYIITYNVKDIAGNAGVAQKIVAVYDPDDFNVFINGQIALGNQINLNSPKIEITTMNAQGNVKAKYLPGKKYKGNFKTKGTILDGKLPGAGYYTIYLQDSDRNSRLVYVFVQE